ncbi:MAG: TerB family tellurite resistance protein [Hyphomicrobiaceae bacterium]
MTIWQTISGAAAAAVRSDALAPLLRALGLDATATGKPQHGVTFTIAIVALSAKMAKSDGVVTFDEMEAFRRVCSFPECDAENVRRVFDLAKQDTAGYEHYARQIGKLLADEPKLRLDVLEGLFVIAAADGVLHEREEHYLADVARLMGITQSELAWVRSLFVSSEADPYTTLGLSPSATSAEIKSSYRRLVTEHHPDRLVGRGVPAEFVTIAERKLAAINVAYDKIARERGL